MPPVQTSRGTIYCADQRNPELFPGLPPLILIHGAGGTHLDWSMQLRKMNSLVPDLPGHGKSPKPGRVRVEDYAADIIALLDALQLPAAILCGQSMGGAVALQLALIAPERVKGLILIGTGAKLSVHPRILEQIQTDQVGVGLLLKNWLWSKDTPDAFRERTYTLFMQLPPQTVYGDYTACNQFDVRAQLGEIHTPTLVITADQDQMTPPRFGTYLAGHIEGAQLVQLTGAGHMMSIEAADRVATTVQTWLKQTFSI